MPLTRAAPLASANISREPGVPCSASTGSPFGSPYSAQARRRPSGSVRRRNGGGGPVVTIASMPLCCTKAARQCEDRTGLRLFAADDDVAGIDHQDHALALIEAKRLKRGDGDARFEHGVAGDGD